MTPFNVSLLKLKSDTDNCESGYQFVGSIYYLGDDRTSESHLPDAKYQL